MLFMLLDIASILLTMALYVIIAQGILSWLVAFNVINTRSDVVRNIWSTLDRLTEPLYRPIRRILPDFGALDLTPMVVGVTIIILRGPVLSYLGQLAAGGV
ncbi:MAG: YggT family protein [Sphingopyxis sp.]